MNKKRVRRIEEEIKKIISSLIMRELKDPRIDEFASITRVKVTNDLSQAEIYVSAFTEEKREETVEGLNSAKGYIKREIAQNLDLRTIPDLIFIADESIEKSFEFYELLDKVKKDEV